MSLGSITGNQIKEVGSWRLSRGEWSRKEEGMPSTQGGWLERQIRGTVLKSNSEKVTVKWRARNHFTWSKMEEKELALKFTECLCSLLILVFCHIPLPGTHPNMKNRQLVHTCLCEDWTEKKIVNRLSKRIPEIMNFKYILFGYPSPWATYGMEMWNLTLGNGKVFHSSVFLHIHMWLSK